jgi:protein-disulfide isomerase
MRRASVCFLIASILASGCGGSSPSTAPEDPALRGADSLQERFGGIAQNGRALGSPRAPYTLVEFADLQCPFCARFHRDILPTVIERFVRPGRLRLELRPVAFLGPDSSPAAAAVVAAGLQDRMWQFADLFYRNQGSENSGYVTPRFIGGLAESTPGLDAQRFLAASGSRALVRELEQNARAARTARVSGTPGFRLGRTGRVLAPFSQGAVEREDFVRRLAAEL